jgi:hypothetical protein
MVLPYLVDKTISEGVGVMKDKEVKLVETEVSQTLGGVIKYTEVHQPRFVVRLFTMNQ